MRYGEISLRRLAGWITGGVLLTDAAIIGGIYLLTGDTKTVLCGAAASLCTFLWGVLLTVVFQKKLSRFTGEICLTLEQMMTDTVQDSPYTEEETLLSRIIYRLNQLYRMMQRRKETLEKQREELQKLVSDISHQTKTPVTNLKMLYETLLGNGLSLEERGEFLRASKSQVDKLDFLVEAMVKTSRLETGVIRLEKKNENLYHTLAVAVGGIFAKARQKQMEVAVDCPEQLMIPHDGKWTAEAVFNLLDNAVKYSPRGGSIKISVELWEAYAKIDIADNGKGIPESRQALIFQRFYREQEVHDQEGIGIGLYLTREIITIQGGYVQVKSREGEGAVFSVFLPADWQRQQARSSRYES